MAMVAIDVVELEKSMKRNIQTMGKNPKKKEPCTIHSVFHSVRREHGEDYDLKIIAIGPFHHNKGSLKPMELLRWRYLRQLLRRNPEKNTLQNFTNVISEAKTTARNYYSEPVESDANVFVEMMGLDGGFLVEYLVKAYTRDNERYLNEHQSAILVHPSGVERSLHRCIDTFGPCYSDKQGRLFRVWMDRVSSSQIGSNAWLVKFDKWELSDEGRQCCLTTVLLNSKPDTPEGFTLVHVHQTWLDGYAARDQNAWIF